MSGCNSRMSHSAEKRPNKMYLSLTSKDCGVFSYKQGRSLGGLKMRKRKGDIK